MAGMHKWMTIALLAVLSMVAHAQPIGVVQLALGEGVWVERDQQKQPLKTGDAVYEKDILHTADNSRVHLKMNDDAIVALRPHSILQIECYQINVLESVCLKLNLLKGEVRQITGKAGQSQKNRFRLNTPVAAIGIRGTDFIARAQGDQSLIKVLSGEIVASPFQGDCIADALGPCSGGWARALSGQDGKILLLEANTPPIYILNELDPDLLSSQLNHTPSESNSHSTDAFQVLSEDPNLVKRFLEISGYTPVNYEVGQLGENETLVFGTWSSTPEGLALSYPQARHGREITVGNRFVGIWRTQLTQPLRGQASLKPENAYFTFDDATFLNQVQLGEGSRLNLNFDDSSVSAKIILMTGDQIVDVIGSDGLLSAEGMFTLNTSGGGHLGGAVSEGIDKAATLLSQPVNNGVLQGQILWAK